MVVLLICVLLPLIFVPNTVRGFSPITCSFIFPVATVNYSTRCYSGRKLSFLFTLVTPVVCLPDVLVCGNKFSSDALSAGLVLLMICLITKVFKLFLNSLTFNSGHHRGRGTRRRRTRRVLLRTGHHRGRRLRGVASSDGGSRGGTPCERRHGPTHGPSPTPRGARATSSSSFSCSGCLSNVSEGRGPGRDRVSSVLGRCERWQQTTIPDSYE